jgi:hypothetical protein
VSGRAIERVGPLTRDDRWNPIRTTLFAAFGIAYVAWFFFKGVIIDRISVTISIAILLIIANVGKPLKRWGVLLVEVSAYVAMWFIYERTRGVADSLGMPLQVEMPRNIDRTLFFGRDPNVWMQRRLYHPDRVRWYDVWASMTYYSHFIVPPIVIAILWVARRQRWLLFMRRFATVLGVACVSFVLLPTAPPWMAASGDRTIPLDALDPIVRHAGRGWRHIGLQGFVHQWEAASEWVNRTAAMPSLHTAFPVLIVAFFWRDLRHWWWRGLALLYPLSMCWALVYLGEHYVADELGGMLCVLISFVAWNRIEAWWNGRNEGEHESQQPGNFTPDDAEAAIIGA